MTAEHRDRRPQADPVIEAISSVLGRIPSGVFILTARHGEQETGMLASWVMQAGFDPPMVSVAIRHGRYLADWLRSGTPFVLNILSEGQAKTLRHFGRGFAPGEEAFDGIDLRRTPEGLPVLASAIGHLVCEPTGSIDSGDHHVFLARVTSGSLASAAKPMVHVRKTGMKY